MVAEYTSSYTSLRDRQVPGSHRNWSTACQSETLPWITKDSGKRRLAKGRNFESSGRGLQGSSRNIIGRSIRAFALCKFADWPVYETLGLETSSSSGFFFKGNKQALARSTPSSMALNTVGTEKSSSLTPGAVTRGLEGNDDIDCRANDVSIKVDSETISTQKKKVRSHHREKERKRENEWKKKEKKKSNNN